MLAFVERKTVLFCREKRTLARKRVHSPANTHANEEEEEQRPQDVFDALAYLAPAQEAERDGDKQREKRQRLKMGEVKNRPAHALRPRAAS